MIFHIKILFIRFHDVFFLENVYVHFAIVIYYIVCENVG